MKKFRIAADAAGILGALLGEFILLALLGWARTVRGRYETDIYLRKIDDERIN